MIKMHCGNLNIFQELYLLKLNPFTCASGKMFKKKCKYQSSSGIATGGGGDQGGAECPPPPTVKKLSKIGKKKGKIGRN